MPLENLTDEEFASELRASIWRDDLWNDFMEPHIIDRTEEALTLLHTSITGQISHYKFERSREWLGRARHFATQAGARKAQVKKVIRNLNRAETAEVASMERKWGAFAQTLATALEQSDRDHLLDAIVVRDELTAREWLAARRMQQATKSERNGEKAQAFATLTPLSPPTNHTIGERDD